jgi:hypothetical protein
MELGYNPYGSGGYGSAWRDLGSFHDEDADGFMDISTGLRGGHKDDFDESDFDTEGFDVDPFPDDGPVWE